MQPLSGAQARIDDRHLILGQTGEADQISRQVHDLDRLAHVEDEDDAAVGRRSGLEHEADGLGDRHEVARGVGMGDRDGPALLQLPLEYRNHAAARGQDVAEPHGHVRPARAPGAGDGKQLGQALGGAHRRDRLHRFVRGDEHEALHAEPLAGGDDVLRAEDVGHRALGGGVLDHGHVLESRSVEDHVGPGAADDGVDGLLGADVGQDELAVHVGIGRALRQLALDRPESLLVVVDDGYEPRADVQDLADQLAADRSAAARHQNAGTVEVPGHRVRVDLHRGAAKQVLHADLSNAVGERVAAEQLARVGDRSDLQAQLLAALEGAPNGRTRGRGHGYQELPGVGVAGGLRQHVQPAEDALAHQSRAVLCRVVVDEAHDVQAGVRVPRGDSGNRGPRFAGAVDDRGQTKLLVRAAGHAASLQAGAQGEASAAYQGQAQERLGDEDRPRETGGSTQAGIRQDLEDGHGQDRAGEDGSRQREHLLDRGIAPLAPVQTEDRVRGRHDQER